MPNAALLAQPTLTHSTSSLLPSYTFPDREFPLGTGGCNIVWMQPDQVKIRDTCICTKEHFITCSAPPSLFHLPVLCFFLERTSIAKRYHTPHQKHCLALMIYLGMGLQYCHWFAQSAAFDDFWVRCERRLFWHSVLVFASDFFTAS